MMHAQDRNVNEKALNLLTPKQMEQKGPYKTWLSLNQSCWQLYRTCVTPKTNPKKKSINKCTAYAKEGIWTKKGYQFIIRRVQVKFDKKRSNERTCALACLNETAAAETSSFILRFPVFAHSFQSFPDSVILGSRSMRRMFHCSFHCLTWIHSSGCRKDWQRNLSWTLFNWKMLCFQWKCAPSWCKKHSHL